MNNRLTNFVSVAGNVSQLIIAGSILAEIFMNFRDRKKVAAVDNEPDDDGEDSPSPNTTTLAA